MPYARSRMASEVAGTALRSIYSAGDLKTKSRWDQTLISLTINQSGSESYIPNMVAISKPQLTVSYLRGSEKSVLL